MKKTNHFLLVFGLLAILIILIGFTGCSSTTSGIIKDVDPELLLYKKAGEGTEDLYLKKQEKELEKIAHKVARGTHVTLINNDKIIYGDAEGNTYLYEPNAEKFKLGEDLNQFLIRFTGKGDPVYITPDGDLYIKSADKERLKLASDVWFFRTANENNVYFLDNDDNLYLKVSDKEKEKLAFDVDYFDVASNGKTYYYISTDKELYHVINQEKEKVASEVAWMEVNLSKEGNFLSFISEYNFDKEYGELYIKEKGKDKQKIASDVTQHQISYDSKFIYYLIDEKLYQYNITSGEKVQIAKDVKSYAVTLNNDWIVYTNKDDDLYLYEQAKELEKLSTDINWFHLGLEDKVVYFKNRDNDLYLKKGSSEKEKILSKVQDLIVEYDNIYYLSEDERIGFIKIGSKETNLLIEQANNYQAIYSANNLLYVNLKGKKDLIGYWYDTDEDFFIQFEQDYLRIYPDISEEKIPYEITDRYENSISLESEGDYLEVSFDGSDYITISDYYEEKDFRRSTKEMADEAQAVAIQVHEAKLAEERKKTEIKNNIADYLAIEGLNSTYYYTSYDIFYTIVNNSGYDVEGVELEVTLTDGDQNIIEITSDYIYYIGSGESQESYSSMYSSDPNVEYVNVRVVGVDDLY